MNDGQGRLRGKVALITGAARGMGAAHARAVVEHGGQVVIADVLDDAGRQLAEELGDAAAFVHLDVTSAEQWQEAVAATVDRFGKLNVLVNNAAIATFGGLSDYTEAQWRRIIDVNLTGTYLGVAAAAEALRNSAPSSVINVSSTAGFQGSPSQHGYVATKFAVRGLTKSLAYELGPSGVRVNSIHPGPIRTPMLAGVGVDQVPANALGRIGEPEEVANLVVFLASDESSFSTGSEFLIEGGQLAGSAYREASQ